MEAKYLQENLGCLIVCLKEVAEKRPRDPIEYIAFWLKKHIDNECYKAKKIEESELYEKLKIEESIEHERKARRLEEARRLAEEEAERLKEAEQERVAREAASSKLSMVEEKDEVETSRDAVFEEKVDEQKNEEEDNHVKEGEETEQAREKADQEDGYSPEETAGDAAPEDA